MEALYFSAPWCAPCVAFAPVVESLPVAFTKINVEEQPELAAKYNVSGLPTLAVVRDGKASTLVGAFSRDKVLDWLKSV